MGFASGSCYHWKPPGVAGWGDSETSDNKPELFQLHQLLWGGQPWPRAALAPRKLLHHPLTEEKGLAELLGCGAQRGLSETQKELQSCLWMLCGSDCIQKPDLWSCSAARLLTSSVRWFCAMWCSCAIQSCAKPEGPKLYHCSNSGCLCENTCIMEKGWFPPHSSLFWVTKGQTALCSFSLCVLSLWKMGWWHAQLSEQRETCPTTGCTF